MKVFVLGAQSNIWKGYKSSKYFIESKYVEYAREGCMKKFDLLHLEGYVSAAEDLSSAEKGDVVLFLAGISKPDSCASEPLKSFSINCIGTASLISKILTTQATVLFFSSDAVFEGNSGIVNEDTEPCPKSIYSKQKHLVEEHFKNYRNFKILRMSYVLSKHDFMLQSFEAKKQIDVYTNFHRNVIVEDDIYLLLRNFILNQEVFPSKLHACGSQNLSKYDIAQIYAQKYGQALFQGCLAPSNFFVNRSKKIEMESIQIQSVLDREPMKISEWI